MPDFSFGDRLDPSTFTDDEVIGVFVSDLSEDDALWLSQRIFYRLATVARAYEPHALPLLGGPSL